MPLAFRQLWESRFDWGLWSEREPGLGDRRDLLPRGRVLGGSSSLNTMIYIRGNRADYDGWAAMGLAGWGYEDVLPYFRRAEDNERGESYYHGVGGPLTVSDGRSMQPLVGACIEAAVDAGIRHRGSQRPDAGGAGWFQLTQRDGRRCSTGGAYLHPAAGVATSRCSPTPWPPGSFEGERAAGVEILSNNELETVRAEREVIVCAGAYQSPHLLLLSGIGPADELRALGIEPRVDLPVGKNLHDHPIVGLVWLTEQESLRTAMTPENLALFEREGRGPLTSGFSRRRRVHPNAPGLAAPDIQFHFGAGGAPGRPRTRRSRGRLHHLPHAARADQPRTGDAAQPSAHAKPRILHNYSRPRTTGGA